MMVMENHNINQRSQQGAALIILVLILVIAGTAALFSVLDSKTIKIERDKQTVAMLAEAKALLIGYTLDRVSAGTRPGSMPRPDSFASTEAPFNYDGASDTGCLNSASANGLPLITTGVNIRCLGRFPWATLGMAIDSPSENDSIGQMPWYVVSANLTDVCLKELNSNILNYVYLGAYPVGCPGVPVSATLPYPWLTVRDKLGNILSNRVAAIIIIPGAVIGAQSRPTSPNLGAANQYLDTVTVLPACVATTTCVPGTYDNAGLGNDFIKADDISTVSAVDPNYQQPYVFNDKLIYITIDELMVAVEKRAAQEAASQLRKYYIASSTALASRFYPYAATLGDIDNACVENKLAGLLPASASCLSNSSCSSSFTHTPVVSFTYTCAANYTEFTGSCTFAGKTCTCTGEGSCSGNPASTNNSCPSSASLRKFTCDTNGNCTSNIAGQYVFTYTLPIPDNTVATGNCTASAPTITCNGSGTFSVTSCSHPNKTLTGLPVWFTDNRWQDFMYYAISSDCTSATPGCVNPAVSLTVGSKNNIDAVVISAGKTIAPKVRPSAVISVYLDKADLAPYGTTVFDAVGTPKSSAYNDQMFIVAPQ